MLSSPSIPGIPAQWMARSAAEASAISPRRHVAFHSARSSADTMFQRRDSKPVAQRRMHSQLLAISNLRSNFPRGVSGPYLAKMRRLVRQLRRVFRCQRARRPPIEKKGSFEVADNLLKFANLRCLKHGTEFIVFRSARIVAVSMAFLRSQLRASQPHEPDGYRESAAQDGGRAGWVWVNPPHTSYGIFHGRSQIAHDPKSVYLRVPRKVQHCISSHQRVH